MTITPRELLELAHELLKRTDEASQRAAASRAYYGAYHLAEAVRTRHEIPLGQAARHAGVHENLIVALERCGGLPRPVEVKAHTLGTMLRHCRDLRTAADYNLGRDFLPRDAVLTVSQSRQVEKIAQDLLK